MIFVAVDPGAISGAYAAIDHNGEFVACGDIQSVDGRVNATQLRYDLKACISTFDTAMVAIENVHTMPNQGIASSGKFMRAAGSIEATVELMRYPFLLVRPQVWKKHHGLIGTEKSASLDLARKLFPSAPLTRKKDTGRADALLMATWLKENHG